MMQHRLTLGLVVLSMLCSAALAVVVIAGTPALADPKPGRTPVPGLKARDQAQVDAMARSTYVPQPSASIYPLRNAAEVAQNILSDPFFNSVLEGQNQPGQLFDPRVVERPTPLAPVYVRALVGGNTNEYIVPVVSGGRIVGLFTVPILRDGQGAVGSYRHWDAPTFPAVTEADARRLAAAPGDPAESAELVWALVLPIEGGSADERTPFWRILRQSATELYLFETGGLRLASEVRIRGR
jgi:hypothetical protein